MFSLQEIYHSHLSWKQEAAAPLKEQFTACLYAAISLTGVTCHALQFGGVFANRLCVGTICLWCCYSCFCRTAYRLVGLCRPTGDHHSLNLSFPLLPFSGISSIRSLMTLHEFCSTCSYWTCLRFAKWLKYRGIYRQLLLMAAIWACNTLSYEEYP